MQALYSGVSCNFAPDSLGSSEWHTERAARVKRRYNSSLPAGRVASRSPNLTTAVGTSDGGVASATERIDPLTMSAAMRRVIDFMT